ncbi:MAG: hypothetical protein AB7F88_03955 [Pyrinomonadaceae bacterium]
MKQNFGIAFVTGRPQFTRLLRTYFGNWKEHGLIENEDVDLHLFVVYDVTYKNVPREEFRDIPPDIAESLASINIYGRREVDAERERLVGRGALTKDEGELLFGEGYAKKRNAALYFALQQNMNRLLFLDDDEYPVAVTKTGTGSLAWMGQSILATHLKYGKNADITNGLHCGYISPIPRIRFDNDLTESDFRTFIEAISNDILSWESVKRTIFDNGGVTYADAEILLHPEPSVVPEEYGRKFISGGNLSIGLDVTKHIPVFYNPPGARGEDAFMSTMLSGHNVVRVPCYSFHDAFSQCPQILDGVLPQQLKAARPRAKETVNRFARAVLGWARYKPLLTYITQREKYDQIMSEATRKLDETAPKLSRFFNAPRFEMIASEFRKYHANVLEHHQSFEATKRAWSKAVGSLRGDLAVKAGV